MERPVLDRQLTDPVVERGALPVCLRGGLFGSLGQPGQDRKVPRKKRPVSLGAAREADRASLVAG